MFYPVRSAYAAVIVIALALSACDDAQQVNIYDPPPPGGGGDVTPPAQITDVLADYPQPGGDIIVTWTAPADDDGSPVDHYEVRYGYSFPLNWNLAIEPDSTPSPGAPGDTETVHVPDPSRGRDFYVAVRSADAAGNVSEISPVAYTHVTGFSMSVTCTEIPSGLPVEGLDATITERRIHHHTTDAFGVFTDDDVAAGVVGISIRSGSGDLYHEIRQTFEIDSDVSLTYKVIKWEAATSDDFDNILSVFWLAAEITPRDPVFRKWRSYPVPMHIPDFVNIYGLDYGAIARDAALRWEELTGIDLFEFVDTTPASGIDIAYKTREEMGIHNGITYHTDDAEDYPLFSLVNVLDEYANPESLRKAFLHEIGHTIRLGHMPAGFLMSPGQPLPPDPTSDEIKAVQLYIALPNGLDMSVYDPSDPVR